MKHRRSQRELRRAVADLAQCAIEDIESVWAELSPDERARLQPLLGEATGLGGCEQPVQGARCGTPARADSSSSSAAPAFSNDKAWRVAQMAQTLPATLAVRLLASVDTPIQREILDKFSDAQRASLNPALCDIRLTQRARATWLAACVAQADDAHSTRVLNTASRKQTLLSRIRDWTGRRT